MEKKKGSNKKNKKTKKTIKKSVKKARKYSKYNLFFIPLRYFILFILALSLPIIYKILTPLTVYTSAFLLNLFFDTVIIKGNFIILDLETIIELIPACIAGSAYLLLLILNLTIPMNAQKRFLSIIFSIIILFISNI